MSNNTLAITPSNATSLETFSVVKLSQTDSSIIDTSEANTNISHVKFPKQEIVLLYDVIDEWQIVQPLAVTIEHSNGLYIASDNIFGVYGDGDTEYKALNDYKTSLIDYYQLIKLRAQQDNETQALLRHLELYISHIPN